MNPLAQHIERSKWWQERTAELDRALAAEDPFFRRLVAEGLRHVTDTALANTAAPVVPDPAALSAVPMPAAERIVGLMTAANCVWMTVREIAAATGMPYATVRGALGKKSRNKGRFVREPNSNPPRWRLVQK